MIDIHKVSINILESTKEKKITIINKSHNNFIIFIQNSNDLKTIDM